MNEIDKVIYYIRSQSEKSCKEIEELAADECARIKTEYSHKEQDKYWDSINAGTKDAETRLENLSNLAKIEAKKQIYAMQQELLSGAFDLATVRLNNLPADKLAGVLSKHGIPVGSNAAAVVDMYRERMARAIMTMLFD